MKTPSWMLLLPFLLQLLVFVSEASSLTLTNRTVVDFVDCLSSQFDDSAVYTRSSPFYYPILLFSIHNHRFVDSSLPKPLAIVAPRTESQIQQSISCAKKHRLQIRVRSGGHDFEGLSSISEDPFVVLDLFNLRQVKIDVESASAWVQAGARLGELYYEIDKESNGTLAYTGGDWPSVGLGGQISGGGYGTLLRKYGLAADNVLDAILITANGTILDRKCMGEDLFWAIRGGGGGNFGIVFSWKLKLVSVPQKVTVFTISRTLEQNATDLVLRWQEIAPKLPDDIFLGVNLSPFRSTPHGKKTIRASFPCLFLGDPDDLLAELKTSFPELGVERKDLLQMSFLESCLYFVHFPLDRKEVLLNRVNPQSNLKLKQKSDFVKSVIPETGIQGICEHLLKKEPGEAEMTWSAFGGAMERIDKSEIPFPHRSGYLFIVYQAVYWCEAGTESDEEPLGWMRELYDYMGSYVSQNPRAQYANYKDLDLGTTNHSTTPEEARTWGVKYFDSNFDRLVRVKTMVDPDNFFRNQQSIPPRSLPSPAGEV